MPDFEWPAPEAPPDLEVEPPTEPAPWPAPELENEADHIIHVTMLRTISTRHIVYLEAGKDLVDVLLSFLVLPVGTIIGLLNAEGVKQRKFGAVDNIYKSVDKLQESMLYIDKKLLTKPRPASPAFRGPALLQLEEADQTNTHPAVPTEYHLCGGCRTHIGTEPNFMCPCGRRQLCGLNSQRVTVVPSKEVQPALVSKPKEGYVKKSVTYIVSNNLEIVPSSSIKCIDVLNKMKVQNLSDLQSIDQGIGRKDVLNILLAAISGSETPLSDVFDGKVEESTF